MVDSCLTKSKSCDQDESKTKAAAEELLHSSTALQG